MPPTLEPLFDLSGKTAVITGGARAPGLMLARALGEAGARIMLADTDADALEEAMATLQDSGIDTRWRVADSAQPADGQHLVDETLHRMGDIDILVHAALALSASAPLPDWDLQMALTVRGPMLLNQSVARRSMIGRGGRILHLAPPISLGDVLASTCRGALKAYVCAQAASWRQHGITVNALAWPDGAALPGLADSVDLSGLGVLLASDAGCCLSGQWLTLGNGRVAPTPG